MLPSDLLLDLFASLVHFAELEAYSPFRLVHVSSIHAFAVAQGNFPVQYQHSWSHPFFFGKIKIKMFVNQIELAVTLNSVEPTE